jgi:hypothetical protein
MNQQPPAIGTWSVRKVSALALLGLVCLAGYLIALQRFRLTVANPLLRADNLDVGDVWEQPAFRCSMTIQNTGAKDIVIEGFGSSCGCLSVEPTPLMIRSGGQEDIQVTLNLMVPADQERTDFAVSIVPSLRNEAHPPPVLKLRGCSHRLLKLRPTKVSFYGMELLEEHQYPSLTAVATALRPLDSLEAKCSPSLASVQVIPSKQDHNEFQIVITPSKALPLGPFRFEVLLEPKDSAATYPALPLLVEGRIASDVQAFPDSLVLGPGKKGDKLSESVTLRSASGRAFEVKKIDITSPDITVEPAVVPSASGKTFRIVQNVSKPGTLSSSVRFGIRKDNGKDSTIVVNVLCLSASG